MRILVVGTGGVGAAVAAVAQRRSSFELRSTFLPTDELCLLAFEAESSAVVGDAAERAAIEVERIVEVVE